MNNHAKAEHDNNRVHTEFDSVYTVQHIEDSVITDIYDQRVDCIIYRFANPDKNIINDGTASICDIEWYKLYNNHEDIICVLQALRITKERQPKWNSNPPQEDGCACNEVIIESPELFIPFFAIRADDLCKRGNGNQQPSPNKGNL